MDNFRFQEIIKEYKKDSTHRIGTLSEKSLHAILKKYLCEDEACHEVKIGQFYADIFKDEKILEIQTRALNKLRPKLDYYLDRFSVTIVYPITHYKYLSWINPETGEASEKRKSPKVGKISDIFYELYKIKMYMNHPNLKLHVILVDCDEIRNLDGWSRDKKRGSSRYERIPIRLVDEKLFTSKEDYLYFLKDVPSEFTNDDLKKALKINIKYATIATNIFSYMGIISVIGKKGKKNIYKKTIQEQ